MNVSEEDKKDKLWKIRPWINELLKKFLTVTPEENYSIDEMMGKYTGKTSPIRPYIKGNCIRGPSGYGAELAPVFFLRFGRIPRMPWN